MRQSRLTAVLIAVTLLLFGAGAAAAASVQNSTSVVKTADLSPERAFQPEVSQPQAAVQPTAATTPPPVVHIVQPGEGLSGIGQQYGGIDWQRLCDANPDLPAPQPLYSGTSIRIPAADEVLTHRPECELPKPPPPTQVSLSHGGSSGTASSAPPTSGDVWYDLAMCETGGKMDNPNTGNGYYGYFQFSLSTWQSVGGTGLPSDHSYEEQKQKAQELQARSGWGQWPRCSSNLGLR